MPTDTENVRSSKTGSSRRPVKSTRMTLLGRPASSRSTSFEQFEIARVRLISYRTIWDLVALGPLEEGGSVVPEIHYAKSGDVHIAYQVFGSGPGHNSRVYFEH